MLTLKQIYDNKEAIIAGLEKKHFGGAREAIEKVIAIDAERKAAQQKKDAASAEMNQISKSIGALMAQGKKDEANAAKAKTGELKETIKTYEAEMEEKEEAIKKLKTAVEITRFKGLGEISSDEFAEFIGEDIRLDEVKLSDEESIIDLLEFYMGDNTIDRQKFIKANLKSEEELDGVDF